jgi:hypothetical protein
MAGDTIQAGHAQPAAHYARRTDRFEDQLRAADALRNMDAAEYKHVVLGLIFLKYISDAFEEHHARLEAERDQGADPEDPDEYRAVNIFWVPPEARWSHLKANARQPTIGKLVDDAMVAIERDNPSLKGVLPKDYARPAWTSSAWASSSTWSATSAWATRSTAPRTSWAACTSTSCRQFASAEGKKGGQFYTPRCVVRCWSRCSPRTRAGSTTRAVGRAACSSSRSGSSRPTAAASATSASTARSRITPPGGWPR